MWGSGGVEVRAKADPEFHPKHDVFLFFMCVIKVKGGLVGFFLLSPPTNPTGPGKKIGLIYFPIPLPSSKLLCDLNLAQWHLFAK